MLHKFPITIGLYPTACGLTSRAVAQDARWMLLLQGFPIHIHVYMYSISWLSDKCPREISKGYPTRCKKRKFEGYRQLFNKAVLYMTPVYICHRAGQVWNISTPVFESSLKVCTAFLWVHGICWARFCSKVLAILLHSFDCHAKDLYALNAIFCIFLVMLSFSLCALSVFLLIDPNAAQKLKLGTSVSDHQAYLHIDQWFFRMLLPRVQSHIMEIH